MARFDPLVQQYVRHSGIWHASLLPVNASDQPIEGVNTPDSTIVAHDAWPSVQTQQDEQVAYSAFPDYAQDLAKISIPSTLASIAALEAETKALTDEAEYLFLFTA
jgi:hypothetical protein